MAQASDPSLVPGTQAFLNKVGEIIDGAIAGTGAAGERSAGRADDLRSRDRLQPSGVFIALLITAILVIGIKESARFNATIVVIKVAVVLFVIVMGIHYVNTANWGHDWSTFAPYGFSGIGAGAAYIFFAYIGFDAVSTTAQEAKNPQRDLPIGIIASLLVCTVLYILVAAVLTGMVPWQEINIEAPIARAFLDRGLTTASHVITVGALAGLTSVMLVMLLGQTRVLYSMANDGLLPQEILRRRSTRSSALPGRTRFWWACWRPIVGSVTPIDDIGKMVNIGTLLAFVIVCVAIMVLRKTNPSSRGRSARPGCRWCRFWASCFNGYMMYKLGWINWARLIIWLVIGLCIYFGYGVKHSHLRQQNASGRDAAAGVCVRAGCVRGARAAGAEPLAHGRAHQGASENQGTDSAGPARKARSGHTVFASRGQSRARALLFSRRNLAARSGGHP